MTGLAERPLRRQQESVQIKGNAETSECPLRRSDAGALRRFGMMEQR